MFLNYLEKREKELFLEMAYLLANSDNEFSYEEKKMIQYLKDEMGIKDEDYQIANMKFENILHELKDSSIKNKKSIFVELVAIAYSDNNYSIQEKTIIKKIMEEWGINKNEEKTVINFLKKLQSLYKEIGKFLSK